MKVMTSVWDSVCGWSTPLPALDSPPTLVVVFGDRTYLESFTSPQRHRESMASTPSH